MSPNMPLRLIAVTLPLMLLSATSWCQTVSNLKTDEQVVFFNTHAWYEPDLEQWHLPIHGWVFEAEDSVMRKHLIASSLAEWYDLKSTPANAAIFNQRVAGFLADNERGKRLVIRIGQRTYALPKSQSNGHLKTTLTIDRRHIEPWISAAQLPFTAVLRQGDERRFTGLVNMVSNQGISVISDIDDTIKISQVTERKRLIENTFYLDFKAVPGMANFYQNLANQGASFHFVSSSPWQLYPDLAQFSQAAGFPPASFHLKDFRFKDRTFFNLFKDGTATKPQVITRIIEQYPQRQFILVGDNGEQDPEVYSQIQQQHPGQIRRILIRNVKQEQASDPRYLALFGHLDETQWQLFTDGKALQP